ncbi:MAG: hypothetical protein ACLGIN_00285, partial [Candidatus Sericytochromatia bacterium]
MLRRFHMGALAATLTALTVLSGCGQVASPVAMLQGAPAGMAALADFPDIDAQIGRHKLQATEWGTLVKQLPAVKKTK